MGRNGAAREEIERQRKRKGRKMKGRKYKEESKEILSNKSGLASILNDRIVKSTQLTTRFIPGKEIAR